MSTHSILIIKFMLKELEFNDQIGALCLPNSSSASADFMNRWSVTVQGWGEGDDGSTGTKLSQVELTVRKNSICNAEYANVRESFKKVYMPNLSIDAMFCTDGNVNVNAGTCYGDSGGPTIIK